jgi:putative nucleotidyltransferase with HDIG domain
MPEIPTALAESDMSAIDQLSERLNDAETTLPMLPSVAARVIELSSDPDVHVAQFARLVVKDQVLASRLLMLANSAYNAPAMPVTTLTQAIVRLGTACVRNLVLTISFHSRLCDERTYGPHGRQLMDHSVGTAYLARLVAEVARVNIDEAFLCGLVHDIGKLVIYKGAHDYQRVHPKADLSELPGLLAARHAELGARILKTWRFPDSLGQPVLCHHDYERTRTARRETAVVYLANQLSHRYGFGCEPAEEDPLADPVCAELGVDAAWLAETDVHAPELFEIARQGLQGPV